MDEGAEGVALVVRELVVSMKEKELREVCSPLTDGLSNQLHSALSSD